MHSLAPWQANYSHSTNKLAQPLPATDLFRFVLRVRIDSR